MSCPHGVLGWRDHAELLHRTGACEVNRSLLLRIHSYEADRGHGEYGKKGRKVEYVGVGKRVWPWQLSSDWAMSIRFSNGQGQGSREPGKAPGYFTIASHDSAPKTGKAMHTHSGRVCTYVLLVPPKVAVILL